MQVATIIKRIYPDINDEQFEVIQFDDESIITKWDLEEPQPTKEELQSYWLEYGDEILKEQESSKQLTLEQRLNEVETMMNMILLGGM